MQKNAFHTLSYGVYAVTTMDGERPVGYLAAANACHQHQPAELHPRHHSENGQAGSLCAARADRS